MYFSCIVLGRESAHCTQTLTQPASVEMEIENCVLEAIENPLNPRHAFCCCCYCLSPSFATFYYIYCTPKPNPCIFGSALNSAVNSISRMTQIAFCNKNVTKCSKL